MAAVGNLFVAQSLDTVVKDDEYNAMSTFRDKTIKGIGWSVVSQIGQQAISFIIIIILARLLSPREFGLLAMITVITSFASIFVEMGFSAALVQKHDIRQAHLSSVFWLNLVVGLGFTLAFVAVAPIISRFYSEPLLIPLTMFIAANFLLGSLTIVQKTMMTKALDFRRLAIVDIVAVAFSGGFAIVLAYAGFGVWSLAVQTVFLSAITTVMLWKLGKWRPSFVFDWTAIKDLLGFSSNLFGSTLLNYWVRNLDYLLIGRFIGTQSLGIYKNAYSIMLFPLNNISRVISRVMFPSLSLIQHDKAKVRSVYLLATRAIALVTFPLMTGLFVVVESFVLTLFGSQWSGMIPILRVFCLTGLLQSVATLTGNLYLSQGKADLQFRVGLFVHANAIICIVVGLRWGVLGVAIGYTIATMINSFPSLFFAGRLVDLTFWQVWSKLLGIIGCALIMAIAVWGIGLALPALWPPWLCLVTQIAFGVLFYGVLIHFLAVQAYVETRELLSEQVRHKFWSKEDTLTAIPIVPGVPEDSR
ncbi:MAG: MOP flippase family protein [Kiritimatiellae bacterium]|nr:MOP flippase family protein [Kiritimatiellia bacterium]MCG2812743.1 MOP flippase family protein [Candidatus Aminicenantes bacterium]